MTPFHTKKLKTICFLAIATALLLSLSPILFVSPFARPMQDDYSFGKFVRQNGLIGVWQTVSSLWSGFQGSFFGSALMSLQPISIFSAGAYGAVGFVLLGLLGASIFAFTFAALKNTAKKSEKTLIAAAVTFFCAQYMPYISQAFFWWNGSIYYLGTFSIMLLSVVCMLRLRTLNTTTRNFALKIALICMLEFLLGGTNFIVALFNLLLTLIIFALTLFGEFFRLPPSDRRRKLAQGFFVIFALAGFLLSVLAPGNAIRQAGYVPLSIIKTLRLSITQAFADVITFSRVSLWLGVFALLPLFVSIARRGSFRYPLPPAFLILSFLMFAALNAPSYYAVGDRSFGRTINVNYCIFIILIFANTAYITGWTVKRFFAEKVNNRKYEAIYTPFFVILFCVFSSINIRQTTGFLCLREYLRGTPQAYAAIYDRQYEILTDPAIEVAVIPPQTVYVEVFDFVNNSGDPATWFNICAAEFFGKRLVAESDDPDYVLPDILPAEIDFTIGDLSLIIEGYGYLDTPLIPLRSLAYALRATPYAFGVKTESDGITITLTAGEKYLSEPGATLPRPLDAVRDFNISFGGKKYIRSGFIIGEEQFFSPTQMRQLLSFTFGK